MKIDFQELDRLTAAKNDFDAGESKYREWAYVVLHQADTLIALAKTAQKWRCAVADKPEPDTAVYTFPAPPSSFSNSGEISLDGNWCYWDYDEGAGWKRKKWVVGPMCWTAFPEPPN